MKLYRSFPGVLAWLSVLAISPAGAAGLSGPTPATVERVIDGDTVRVRVAIWIDQELSVSVRIADIDAPELFRPKCAAEKEQARAAKQFVQSFLESGDAILTNIERGKYAGRVVARIESRGRDLGTALVEEGYAVNGKRGRWCS